MNSVSFTGNWRRPALTSQLYGPPRRPKRQRVVLQLQSANAIGGAVVVALMAAVAAAVVTFSVNTAAERYKDWRLSSREERAAENHLANLPIACTFARLRAGRDWRRLRMLRGPRVQNPTKTSTDQAQQLFESNPLSMPAA